MSRKRRSRRKTKNKLVFNGALIARIVCAVLLCAIGLFLVGTRSLVLKPLLLPQFKASTQLIWECKSVSYWPTSGITLMGVVVKDGSGAFTAPVMEAKRISINSPGFKIFNKSIQLSHLKVEDAKIQVIKLANGSSNLDSFYKSFIFKQPLQNDWRDFELDDIEIKNSSLESAYQTKDSNWIKDKLTINEMKWDNWRRENSSTIALKGQYDKSFDDEQSNKSLGSFSCPIEITGSFSINAKGIVETADISGTSTPSQTTGILNSLNGLTFNLNGAYKDQLLSPFQFSATRNGQMELEFSSGGKLNLDDLESNQIIRYSGNLRILNLWTGLSGLQVTDGILNGQSNVYVNKYGNQWTASHDVKLNSLTSTFEGLELPTLNGTLKTQLAKDELIQSLRFDHFSFELGDGSSNVFTFKADQAVNFSLGENSAGFAQTDAISQLKWNLSDWLPLLPDPIAGGALEMGLKIDIDNDGREISWEGNSSNSYIELKSRVDETQVNRYALDLTTEGPFRDLKTINNGIFNVSLSDNGQMKAKGTLDLLYLGKTEGYNTNFSINFEDLNELSQMVPIPYLQKINGKSYIGINFSTLDNTNNKLNFTFLGEQLNGTIFDREFSQMKVDTGFRLDFSDDILSIDNARTTIGFGIRDAFSVIGNYKQNNRLNEIEGSIKVLQSNHLMNRFFYPVLFDNHEIKGSEWNGKVEISSPSQSQALDISTDIVLKNFKPQGIAGVEDNPMSIGVQFQSAIEGSKFIIKDGVINFSPLFRNEENKLNLQESVEFALNDWKLIWEQPLNLLWTTERLVALSWIEFLNLLNKTKIQNTSSNSKTIWDNPVTLQISGQNIYNGSLLLQQWDRSVKIYSSQDIISGLKAILPPLNDSN